MPPTLAPKSPTASIDATFAALRQARRKAVIPFVMGGDPDLDTTRGLLLALAEGGADLLEVGMPFSDPLADGPVIQRASTRALAHGTTLPALLEVVADVARRVTVPIVLLSYWNPILQYGGGRQALGDPTTFVDAAKRHGLSGVIVPDLIPEEADEFRRRAEACGVSTIFLAAPTSSQQRLRTITRASTGFVYYVSVTGTTGVRTELPRDWMDGVRRLKLVTTKPVCVGFGISTREQAVDVAKVADGVIIGSALVRAIESALPRGRSSIVDQARGFFAPIRQAVM